MSVTVDRVTEWVASEIGGEVVGVVVVTAAEYVAGAPEWREVPEGCTHVARECTLMGGWYQGADLYLADGRYGFSLLNDEGFPADFESMDLAEAQAWVAGLGA